MNYFSENLLGRNDNPLLRHHQNDPGELPRCGISNINYLHEEMRQCFRTCLNHAAVLTANALLEAVLRQAIYDAKGPKEPKLNANLWEKLQKSSLSHLIDDTVSCGKITDKEGKKLHEARNLIRNAYQHGRFPDEVKKSVPVPAIKVQLSTGTTEQTVVDPSKNPSLAGVVLMLYDRSQMPAWALHIDKLTRRLMARHIKAVKDGKYAGFALVNGLWASSSHKAHKG